MRMIDRPTGSPLAEHASWVQPVAVGGLGALAVIASVALPNAMASRPLSGVGLVAVIAIAVVVLVALLQRAGRRRPVVSAVCGAVTLLGSVVGRGEHRAVARIAVLMTVVAVAGGVTFVAVVVHARCRRR